MSQAEIDVRYSLLLHSYGLPYRLQNGRSFRISTALKTFTIGEEKVVNVSKQVKYFDMACKEEPGWTMYVCAEHFLEKPKHIAANVMQHYFERDLKSIWLTSFEKLDKIKFHKTNLVIIDALFFDTSAFRRDKIYETINHHCNNSNLSLIVIGKHTDPMAMASQLGMRPDFGLMCK